MIDSRVSRIIFFFYLHLLSYSPPSTLILLTWRIWWVPNSASKGQMGFNLAFKGLITMFDMALGLI